MRGLDLDDLVPGQVGHPGRAGERLDHLVEVGAVGLPGCVQVAEGDRRRAERPPASLGRAHGTVLPRAHPGQLVRPFLPAACNCTPGTVPRSRMNEVRRR
ncbi:hypothetical protein ACFVX9_10160 [Kitasatospora sp. NPDC058243]|uniref:hypothetical protein n=1 Tax=Kitasatospora sp. NPDC058243 TaxID=3346397 RepID=UPI0036DEF1E1